jgi:hypothetical protein
VGALVPWQWPASPVLFALSRCCAAEIQQALLAALAGEAFLADKPWNEIWWGRIQLDLASGWRLQIGIDRDRLGALMWARSPDGRDWEYGCQRDDWALGPHSRIIEPVALLEEAQQQALEALLRAAICWPAPLTSSQPVTLARPMEPWDKPGRSRRRRQRVSPMAFWHRCDAVSHPRPRP